MMISLLFIILISSLFAIFSSRMLIAVLSLGIVSALTSMLLYLVGAKTIAVIELSVGTGLATVLMVFVITMIGDEHERPILNPIATLFVLTVFTVIVMLTIPMLPIPETAVDADIRTMIWQTRGLDWLPQIALMFVGTIGALALSRAHRQSDSLSMPRNDADITDVAPDHIFDELGEAA